MESFYPADFEFLTQNRILQRPLLEARNYYERNRSEFERLLKKYGKLIHSRKTADVEVRRSSVHGCGLFAEKTLSKGDWIGQYTGEQRWALPFTKKTDYAWLVPAPTFPRLEINALKKGNALRFANHSFTPNAAADHLFIDGHWIVFFYAARTVERGEEIFTDYGETYWSARQRELRIPRELFQALKQKQTALSPGGECNKT